MAAEEEAGGGAAARQLGKMKQEPQREERPDWLPEGWTVLTKFRNNGRVDRYYTSLLTGETLRSKAKVILHANRHMLHDVELQAQSTLRLDEKQYSESNKLRDNEKAHFSVPDGWIVGTKYRKGGIHPGASYKTYFNPETGFKCYSLKDVFRYVTGGEPRRGTKKRAALSSPDSVLTHIDGSLKREHFGLENASRLKKNKIPSTATTQQSSTARRSLFGSPMLSFNGIAELSLEDPFFQNFNMDSNQCTDASEPFPLRSIDVCNNIAGDNFWSGQVNDIFEDHPDHQNVFPEHCQEAGKTCNSIDELIGNLSHDLKIPDINIAPINIAYTTYIEQGLFNQGCNIGAGINTRPTVREPPEQFVAGYPERSEEVKGKVSEQHAVGYPEKNEVEISERFSESSHGMQSAALGIKSDYLLLREPWKKAKRGLPFENTKDKLQDTPCELKIETSSTNGLLTKRHRQTGQDSVAANKRETCCRGTMESERANLEPASLQENRESDTPEEMPSKSKRVEEDHPVASSGALPTRERKERDKKASNILPSRTSRRLAGLDAGPNAYVDINEHALRRKKRVASKKETTVEPNKDGLSKAAEEKCSMISQRPDNTSTSKVFISSDTKTKQHPEQDLIIVEDDPMTTEQPLPPSTEKDPITTPVRLSIREDPVTKPPVPPTGKDPITTQQQPVPLSTKEDPVPTQLQPVLLSTKEDLVPTQQQAVLLSTKEDPITPRQPVLLSIKEDPITTHHVPLSTKEDPVPTQQQAVLLSTKEDPITTRQPVLLSIKEDPITTHHVPLSRGSSMENPKPASTKTSLFGEAFLDPCLQFAVQTLTGDLPLFDDPTATGESLFHQQTYPANNGCGQSGVGIRENYHPSACQSAPNGYFHHPNINGFSQPYTPFPKDRVLLNFATGTITPLQVQFSQRLPGPGKRSIQEDKMKVIISQNFTRNF